MAATSKSKKASELYALGRFTMPIGLRLGETLIPEFQVRSGVQPPSKIAKRDLARYYFILRQSLASVHLTADQATELCDALIDAHRQTLADPSLLWAHYEQRATKVNRALLEKLKALDAVQAVTLLDAVERYWLLRETSDQPGTHILRTVGLLKAESRAA